MRDDFWRTPAGADVTRMLQQHYGDIILALNEHSVFLRETDKPRSDCLLQLVDKLFMRCASDWDRSDTETETER